MDRIPTDPRALMAEVSAGAAAHMIAVMVGFERLYRYMDAIGAEGTYKGVDIYEMMQGVRDLAEAALGYLVTPEEAARMRATDSADDIEFERLLAGLGEGGHA